MAQLLFKDVNKVYPNGYHAVHDFNMEIGDGEFICLVGDSGCGKSTTLRMIAGLEDITAGEFYIDGKLANNMSSRDRGIAMVFQSYALYPHLTVYENLAFGLTLEGIDADVIEEKVQATAKILGLTEYLERFPRQLSGSSPARAVDISPSHHLCASSSNAPGMGSRSRPKRMPFSFAAAIPSACRWRMNSRSVSAT